MLPQWKSKKMPLPRHMYTYFLTPRFRYRLP